MFELKKPKKNIQKIAFLCGFSPKEENLSIMYQHLDQYEIDFVDVLSFFEGENLDPNGWKKNIQAHLYELSLTCDSLIVIGYSIGAVLAAHCCNLPYIKKTILISPCYKYMQTFNAHEKYYNENIQKELVERNMNSVYFSSVCNNLIVDFNKEIKKSVSPILLIQGIESYETELSNMFKSIESLNYVKKSLICFKKNNENILLDTDICRFLPFLISDFLKHYAD